MNVTSHSQSGEDLQLAYLLGSVEDVQYIDAGCLWPKTHSNSFFFYVRGGSGLCIDPNPAIAAEFEAVRPRDAFLNCALGESAANLTYHLFRNPVFNTLSSEIAAKRQAQAEGQNDGQLSGRMLIEKVEVPVITLDAAIETAKPELLDREEIDFLTIDVEGFELAVLRGFSFRPRPRVILVESLSRPSDIAALSGLPISTYLRDRGYALAGVLGHNLYFRDA